MNGYDIKKTLETFEILVDTREQNTLKLEGRTRDFSCPFARATLDFGDYTYNVTLPDGSKLHDISGRVYPKTCIERKMDLDELAICLTRDRARFVREFERAQEKKSRIYLMIENGSYDQIINDQYKSWFKPKAYLSSLTAFMSRYDLGIVFVNDYNAGVMIKNILYHDLSERLRRGEFDEGCVFD